MLRRMNWPSFLAMALVTGCIGVLPAAAWGQEYPDETKEVLKTKGKITTDDDKDTVRKQSHCRIHELQFEKDKTYVIDVMSNFDPYIRLENAEKKQLAYDDDGGQGLNSRLVFTPDATATYRLIVTSFRPGKAGTGEYELLVRLPSKADLKKIDPLAFLVGSEAPEIEGVFTLNGETKKLSDLRGKVVLLDFWAVWCGPCIRTFPHLRDLHEEFADEDFAILGVTTYYKFDFENGKLKRDVKLTKEAENEAIKKFAEHHKLKHQLMTVSNEDWKVASQQYGVRGIPTAFVIDRNGVVRLFRVGSGAANAKAIHEEIKKLVNQR